MVNEKVYIKINQRERLKKLLIIFKKFGRNRCKHNGKRVIQVRLNKLDFIIFYIKQNDEICIAGLATDEKKIYSEEDVFDYLYQAHLNHKFSIDAFEMALLANS